MKDREEFEKWADSIGLSTVMHENHCYRSVRTYNAFVVWKARQPEIDALKKGNIELRDKLALFEGFKQ